MKAKQNLALLLALAALFLGSAAALADDIPIDLTKLTEDYTITDGGSYIVTGSAGSYFKIDCYSIIVDNNGSEATVKLQNVNMENPKNGSAIKLCAKAKANVVLYDKSGAMLTSDTGCAIEVPASASLRLTGNGWMHANGAYNCAAIGSLDGQGYGDIEIDLEPPLDGKYSLSVNGGFSENAAGIGGGNENPSAGKILVKNGSFECFGSPKGAGIGSGYKGVCGDITIKNCLLGGIYVCSSSAIVFGNEACIGCGQDGDGTGATITIENGDFILNFTYGIARIGGGATPPAIDIKGGSFVAARLNSEETALEPWLVDFGSSSGRGFISNKDGSKLYAARLPFDVSKHITVDGGSVTLSPLESTITDKAKSQTWNIEGLGMAYQAFAFGLEGLDYLEPYLPAGTWISTDNDGRTMSCTIVDAPNTFKEVPEPCLLGFAALAGLALALKRR